MSKKTGRNEPCPCGSGRKYKKCCGREAPAENLLLPEDQRTGTPIDDYFELLPFLALQERKVVQFESDGPELKKARNRYEKRYRPGEDGGLLDSHFVSWLYFDLRFGRSRKTIAERVLEDPLTARLAEPGPTCLRHMADSYATFYKVIDDGLDVLLLEELGTGKMWNVHYYRELFEIPAGKGEIWYTRLIGPSDRALCYTTPYVYGRETRTSFKHAVDGIIKDFSRSEFSIGVPAERLFVESQKDSVLFWAEYIHIAGNAAADRLSSVPSEWPGIGEALPHLLNTDGEDIVFTEMHFRVKDEPAVRKRLAKLKSFNYDETDDSWAWLKAASRTFPDEPRTSLGHFRFKDGRLIAETNSRERAAKLEFKLKGHLRDLVFLEKTLYRQMEDIPPPSPEEAEKMRRENEELNALPEVREALRKHREHYYFEKWPRQKVPALGNITPLRAAETEAGRRKLIDLLDYFDRIQDADTSGQPKIDFDRLRLMLGLPVKSP